MSWSKDTSICCCGDFCLAASAFQENARSGVVEPWATLREAFGPQVAVIANLECAITDKTQGSAYKWANLRMATQERHLLNDLSLAVLGNNHVGDFGRQGIQDTRNVLASMSIQMVGVGACLEEALQPVFLDLADGVLGVVSLCCPTTNSEYLATHATQGVAPLGMATLSDAISKARDKCDALVVFLHWGCEWVHDPAPDQLRLARHAIDCGADAVVGCHSHTIQSYEQYKGRWIFYGLGNYLFDPVEAQAVQPDGSVERVPLTLSPENRESLVVGFRIVPGRGLGRLEMTRVQPMRYGSDWKPRAVSMEQLSVDLEMANTRLKRYVQRHQRALEAREEPVYRAKLRNGVIAYWYMEESINPASRRSIRRLANKCTATLLTAVKRWSRDGIP